MGSSLFRETIFFLRFAALVIVRLGPVDAHSVGKVGRPAAAPFVPLRPSSSRRPPDALRSGAGVQDEADRAYGARPGLL